MNDGIAADESFAGQKPGTERDLRLGSGRGVVLCEDNDVAGRIGIADFGGAIKRSTPRHDEPLAPKLAFDV